LFNRGEKREEGLLEEDEDKDEDGTHHAGKMSRVQPKKTWQKVERLGLSGK